MEKRKDNRGRILERGEYQKPGGLYEYRYKGTDGATHSVYSWRLTVTDRVPKGKKDCEPLRDIKRQIGRDIEDGIDDSKARKTSLDDFFEVYIEQRPLKQSTRTNYKFMYRNYIQPELGVKKLAGITYSDIIKLFNMLLDEKGFAPNSVEVINTVLHPIFATALRDGLIRKNPTDGVMAEIKRRRDWSKPKRKALTVEQQNAFVDFIRNTNKYCKWLAVLIVLLGTGCRVGEVVGLRWEDCDFENAIISVNHNLIYRQQDNGRMEFHITTPKTVAGIREVPMFDEVRDILLKEREYQKMEGFNETVIDGYSGFIFKNRFDSVLSPHCINRVIERICADYNAEEEKRATAENRAPVTLPHFTAHNMRHTFASRLCENVSDQLTLKAIQEILGHTTIATTMDVYVDLTSDKKKQAIDSLRGKFKL